MPLEFPCISAVKCMFSCVKEKRKLSVYYLKVVHSHDSFGGQ